MTIINRITALSLASIKINCRKSTTKSLKIMASLEEIIAKNQMNEDIFTSLKQQLVPLRKELIERKKKELRNENAELLLKIAAAKAQLIELETRNGKKQIALPCARGLCTQAAQPTTAQSSATAADNTSTANDVTAGNTNSEKATKEKKPKKEKPAQATTAATTPEAPVDVGRLDMRVGKIIHVNRHPDADSLYLEKIDCGEAQPRTVVSGLVKFVPIEEMQNRLVIVLCNLKPAKMRGIVSEAMVMCASTPDKVEVLSPPAGATPGDLVHCEGYNRQPDAQLNPKKKVFETCAPDLMTNSELVACYKGAALHVPGKGNVVSQTLKNVNVK